MMNSLRDNKGSYRAEPAAANLGRRGAFAQGSPPALRAGPRSGSVPPRSPRHLRVGAPACLVQIVRQHQRDEQHRAFAVQPARRALRLGPSVRRSSPPAPGRASSSPVAAADDMRAAADRQRQLRHQPVLPRAMTSSSALTASAMRAFSAAWRRASASAAVRAGRDRRLDPHDRRIDTRCGRTRLIRHWTCDSMVPRRSQYANRNRLTRAATPAKAGAAATDSRKGAQCGRVSIDIARCSAAPPFISGLTRE